MMAFTYPVTLNLSGKKCIVVGGGAVAQRKVMALLEETALVTVVSPALCSQLVAQQHRFQWIASTFSPHCLENCFLVIAATNQRDVNHAVAEVCHKRGILVNVIDSREESSFTVNAAVHRGDFLLAVSTNGISPAFSKKIREQLEEEFGEEYAVLMEILRGARQKAMVTIVNERKRRAFLQNLVQMDLIYLLQNESKEAVQKRVELCLSSYWD